MIPEIGEKGQQKLLNSKVLVVGVGGLGSPAAFYLAAAGVGTLGLLDKDRVELTNLQRQILHSTSRLGEAKVVSGEKVLKDLNPNVQIIKYNENLNEDNVSQIIKGYDVVVAAVDNLAARYLLNKFCIDVDIPLVEGGINNWDGTVHTIIKGKGPCYNCLYPQGKNRTTASGVIGPIAGIVGSWQAMEVIKILLGIGELLTNRMLLIDGLSSTILELEVFINEKCPVCN